MDELLLEMLQSGAMVCTWPRVGYELSLTRKATDGYLVVTTALSGGKWTDVDSLLFSSPKEAWAYMKEWKPDGPR